MRGRGRIYLAAFLAVLLALPGFAARPVPRFQALYWPAFQEDVYALSPGGGFGDYLALAVRGSLLAFIRRGQADQPACSLTLFDLGLNRALATLPLDAPDWDDSWQLGFLESGGLYALHQGGLTLRLFDPSLRETQRFAAPTGFDLACFDPKGRALWCARHGDSSVTRFTLDGGGELVIPAKLPGGWQFSDFAGSRPEGGILSVFSDSRGHSLFLAADAGGKTRLMPVMAGFSWMAGGLAHAALAGEGLLMPVPGEARVLRFADWGEGEYPALFQSGFLMTESFGAGPALRLIDIARGRVIAGLEALAGDIPLGFDHMAISELGFAVLADNQYELNQASLYLWDFRQSPQAAESAAEETTIAGIRAGNDARAAGIAQAFGFALHIRQAGARFQNDTYYARPLDQEPALAHALSSMERTLKQLPAGLLREIGISAGDGFAFYLSGPIRPKVPEGLGSPSAMTAFQENAAAIILDISSPIGVRTLSHELMHLMEERLVLSEGPGGRSLLEDWLLLSPPGAPDRGYFYNYHDQEGREISDTALTADSPEAWERPDQIWFIDAYSRTFPMEDRARLFETLFLAGDTPPELLQYPRLLRKAQYLCAMLREAFPSLKDSPSLPWERHIPPAAYAAFEQEFSAPEKAASP